MLRARLCLLKSFGAAARTTSVCLQRARAPARRQVPTETPYVCLLMIRMKRGRRLVQTRAEMRYSFYAEAKEIVRMAV